MLFVAFSSECSSFSACCLVILWRFQEIVCLFVWLVGFLMSPSTTRLYCGRAPRQSVWQFYVLPHMRQSWDTMTSVSPGHIILTPTQPVGSGRPSGNYSQRYVKQTERKKMARDLLPEDIWLKLSQHKSSHSVMVFPLSSPLSPPIMSLTTIQTKPLCGCSRKKKDERGKILMGMVAISWPDLSERGGKFDGPKGGIMLSRDRGKTSKHT